MIFRKTREKIRVFSIIKRTIDFVFSVIMANNTLGEWSDGEDDWIFEIDEDEILRGLNNGGDPIPNVSDEWSNSEDDELIRNINEEVFLRGLFGNDYLPVDINERSNSEDDELIRNINEDEILRGLNDNGDLVRNIDEGELEGEQTGRGEKRKAENQNVISSDSEDDDPIPSKKRKAGNQNVISSDSEDDDPIPSKKRKAGNQNVISSDSEDDDLIPSKKRKAGNQNVISSDSEDDDPIPSKKRKAGNQNVISSDSEDDDPIPTINDERSNSEGDELEPEQTGRGEKRKAENQNEEQEQDYYQIKPVRDHHSHKFNMTAKNYSVRFNNVLDDVDLLESRKRTYGIFDHLIKDVTKGMNSYDQVRFVLSSKQLQTPIAIPFCPLEELTTEKVLSHVEKVVQSNEEFRLNTTVNIDLIRVEMPQGSGRRSKRTTLNIRDHLKKKGSVIPINNRDNLCLARALVVSIARIENDPRYNSIRDSRCVIQRERAFDLHEAANVPLGPCGLKEVDLFQQYLVNYQIIVVSGEQNNTIIYPHEPPANPNPEKSIYLYYQANHFDVITSLPGFLKSHYFCHTCYKPYDVTADHLCDGMCRSCRGFGCVIQDNGMTCNECDRLFKNQVCYDRHKQEPINGGGRTVCQVIRKCPKCKQSMHVRKIGKPHQCIDNKKCPTCKITRNPEDLNHKCYIQQLEPKEESSYTQLLFFDFECTQEHGIHEVNLCVVYDEDKEVGVFRGKNAVKDFCTWLFTPQHQDCIVIAHNFQGYDSYPILKYLNQNAVPCKVIYNGAKCVTLKTKVKKSHQFKIKIKFIDSLNFIPMALAKFPKTFGQDELCKGYFPHFFNKDENQDYVGPIPCQDDYGVNHMKPEAREKFMTWYQEQVENNYVFDFRHEILKYCRSDVDILAECCKLYREKLKVATSMDGNPETGIDPFDTATTIAGYCMQVYRTKFLQKDTIALLPQHQELKRKQSHEALQWLSYTAEKEGIRIQHARNGGEKRVGNYYLDGYCEETHTAYEYQGCYWHGKDFFCGVWRCYTLYMICLCFY